MTLKEDAMRLKRLQGRNSQVTNRWRDKKKLTGRTQQQARKGAEITHFKLTYGM